MQIIQLPFKDRFIQGLRINQALMEAGYIVNIDPDRKDPYDALKKNFTINYIIGNNNAKIVDVDYSHKDPFVRVGDITLPLLYPMSIVNYCKSFWKEERVIDYIFIGLLAQHRRNHIRAWKETLPNKENLHIHIENNTNGRSIHKDAVNAWDKRYFLLLAKSKFTLCPSGTFTWTYRFFESILCGSIPIITHYAKCYEGFHFYYMDDKDYVYDREKVEYNFNLAIERLTLTPELIQQELNK